MSTITPYLLYKDVRAAIDWLSATFGCTEHLHWAGDGGVVSHAEIRFGSAPVMLGYPGPDARSPNDLGEATQFLLIEVADVDAHHESAKAAGATIVSEPTDQPYGHRYYMAKDPEGHQWSFTQVIREVSPEDWGATVV